MVPSWTTFLLAAAPLPASRHPLLCHHFDESVPYYRLFPYRTAPLPPPPLFLAPGPPLVDPLPPQGPAPSGVSQVDAVEPVEVAVDSGAARGAEPVGAGSRGAESGGAEPGVAESGGTEPGGAVSGGAESRGAEPRGAEPGGAGSARVASRGPSSRRESHSSQELREWFARRRSRSAGAGGPPVTTGPGGARTGGTGAVRTGGAAAAAGVGPAGASGAAGAGAAGGVGAVVGAAGASGAAGAGAAGGVGAGVGAAGGTGAAGPAGVGTVGAGGAAGTGAATGGPGAVPFGSGGPARPRPYFVPLLEQVLGLPPSPGPAPPLECPQPVQSQLPLQPVSPLPSPSSYTGPTRGHAERREPASRPASPVCTIRTSRRAPRPHPPAVPGTHQMTLHPESDSLRAANPTVARLLSTVFTDPSIESTAASALVAELVDFAACCRLDYATRLVAESESFCPPSVGGECALSTDVLEDTKEEFQCFAAALPHLVSTLIALEGDPDAPDIPTPRSYAEAIEGPYSSQWQSAMDAEMASWKSTGTYVDEVPPPGANIVSGMWIFRVKRPPGSPPVFKARYVARGFSQRQGWSLQRPVYGLCQAPCEWHDTLRTTLAALGFAPSTADPSLFLRTDTSLPPFYILVYIDDLVFATANTARLAHVKSELQKRHTCTDLGELRSYLGLQITRDRAQRTITLTQSHMVQQFLQCFDFTYSSPQATPLSTRHSLSALPSDESITRDRAQRTITQTQSHMVQQVLQHFDFTYSSPQATPLSTRHSLSALLLDESVEPSGPYPELVGCLMYLMTCTRPDLAHPLSILARYVAPGRHRPEHMAAAKRVLRYLCSTSGMGLVLGRRRLVVLTGHADASWADDQATQRSSQGYTFSLGSGSVSWRGHGCTGATYLLIDLGEPPRSPPVLYVDNKAMLALCREHRLEHRTKHIALRYFLARELQKHGQLRLAYVASEANTADIFTKALAPGDHQRFCTMLACFALLEWSCDLLFSPTLPMGCGPKAWKILKDVHAPSSEAMVVVLERQLHAVKINEGDAVQGAFDQLRDLYVKLSAAGVDYREKIKCYKALSLLPESWGPFLVNLNGMKDSWSLEWIRGQVLQEEFRRQELTAAAGESGGSAYGMKGFKGRGIKKGKAKEGSGGEHYSGRKRGKFMEGLKFKEWSERRRSNVTIPFGIEVGTNDPLLIPIKLSSSSELTEVSHDLGGAEGEAADVEEVLQQGEAPVAERGDTEEEVQQPTPSPKLPPRRTTQGKHEEINMKQPKGYDDGSGRVCRLNKAIYGLKQAPRCWFARLVEALEALGFKGSGCDERIFMTKGEEKVFLLVYIDGILLFSPSLERIKEVERKLKETFQCKALGPVGYYLGLHVERDEVKGWLRLHQHKYLAAMGEKYGLEEGRSVKTPLPSGYQLHLDEEEGEVLEYELQRRFQSMVGSLMYASVNTHPDIAFSVSQLACVVSMPLQEHLDAAERLVR
ncbi:unnamed protein product [Closterium sp. NIES-53]